MFWTCDLQGFKKTHLLSFLVRLGFLSHHLRETFGSCWTLQPSWWKTRSPKERRIASKGWFNLRFLTCGLHKHYRLANVHPPATCLLTSSGHVPSIFHLGLLEKGRGLLLFGSKHHVLLFQLNLTGKPRVIRQFTAEHWTLLDWFPQLAMYQKLSRVRVWPCRLLVDRFKFPIIRQ